MHTSPGLSAGSSCRPHGLKRRVQRVEQPAKQRLMSGVPIAGRRTKNSTRGPRTRLLFLVASQMPFLLGWPCPPHGELYLWGKRILTWPTVYFACLSNLGDSTLSLALLFREIHTGTSTLSTSKLTALLFVRQWVCVYSNDPRGSVSVCSFCRQSVRISLFYPRIYSTTNSRVQIFSSSRKPADVRRRLLLFLLPTSQRSESFSQTTFT